MIEHINENKKLCRQIVIQSKFTFSNLYIINKFLKLENFLSSILFLDNQICKFIEFRKYFKNKSNLLFIKIPFSFYFMEINLITIKKLFLTNEFLLYNYKSNLYNGLLCFFDKTYFFVKHANDLTVNIYNICLKKLFFLNFYELKFLIYKEKFIKLIIFINNLLKYSNISFFRFNHSINNIIFKKFQVIILNLKKKNCEKNLIIREYLYNINIHLHHRFKLILNYILLKNNTRPNFEFVDFFFIFLIRDGFRFYTKNFQTKFNKNTKNFNTYFQFLTNFYFNYDIIKKNQSYFFTRKNFYEIIFFRKKSFRFWFFLLKKKNFEGVISYFKFIKYSFKEIILKRIKYRIAFNFQKKKSVYKNIVFTKWARSELLKKTYLIFEKKNLFFFFSSLALFWKSFSMFSFTNYSKFYLLDYLFRLREIFFIYYSLYIFYNIIVISFSLILSKKTFKKKLVEYVYFLLEFILKYKNNENLFVRKKYIYLILKEILSFIVGKDKISSIEKEFFRNRLIILLYNFSNNHKQFKNNLHSEFKLFSFNFNSVYCVCKLNETIEKFARNLNYFLYKINSKICVTSKLKIKEHFENKKDQISAISLSITIKCFTHNFLETPEIEKIFLPISIFRSFRFFSRTYYFYHKKEKIIKWKFSLAKFLMQITGFVCHQKEFIFFHNTFEQMLIFTSFNSNLIVFKKDLKFLLSYNKSKRKVLKKKNCKFKTLEIIEHKRIRNIEFLGLNKYFSPKKTIKCLPINVNFFSLEKKNSFFNLKNYLDKENIYLSQTVIVKNIKNINKIKVVLLLITIKKKIEKYFKFDPRGIKVQAQELSHKAYLRFDHKKLNCKYFLI
jgi:hypothetical protein